MKLLNFGSCNIDYVYQLDHIVVAGETESSSELKIFPGGKGLNQSIAVSRAGTEIYHAGAIGKDGEMLLNLLKENGVNVKFLKTLDEKTGHAIIQVASSGENSIVIHSGANGCIDKEYIDFVLANFSSNDFLLLQNEISNIEYIIDKAFEKGMKIILNPSPINERIKLIDINKISYLILNQTEAQALTGCSEESSSLEYFKKNHPFTRIILTLGKKGSIYMGDNQKYYQPSYQVDAVDTTAAGDTFTGFFISGLIKGLSLKNNMKIASCASAIAVTRKGAAPSIPTYLDVKNNVSTMKLNKYSLEDAKIKGIIESVIEDNIATVSILDIANKIGYSSVYTGALIKKLFGITYKELLLEKRLTIAKEALKNSNLTIAEIITMVGYENQGYFRKKFAQKFGKKPLDYKKDYR